MCLKVKAYVVHWEAEIALYTTVANTSTIWIPNSYIADIGFIVPGLIRVAAYHHIHPYVVAHLKCLERLIFRNGKSRM